MTNNLIRFSLEPFLNIERDVEITLQTHSNWANEQTLNDIIVSSIHRLLLYYKLVTHTGR